MTHTKPGNDAHPSPRMTQTQALRDALYERSSGTMGLTYPKNVIPAKAGIPAPARHSNHRDPGSSPG